MARAAGGRADDLLAAILLATEAPVLLVPAMNDRMWAHPQTARNALHLRELGYELLEPEVGDLAVGEGFGAGRMPAPETILAYVGRRLEERGPLEERRVLVTAGATREAVDPVRFLSNRSSGRMGVAVAEAAWRRRAETVLIAGSLAVDPPPGVRLLRVETTDEMCRAVAEELPRADVLVMAAAPADFRPASVATSKIRKGGDPSAIALEPTPDILLATRGARRAGAVIVGFALETDDVLANARAKLDRKGLDLIVVNDAREHGAGFEVATNRVTLLARDGGVDALPLLQKREVADAILDRVAGILDGR